jgi:hypothetical protein
MAQQNVQVPAGGKGGVAGKAMSASAGVPGAQNAQGMASQPAADGGKNWEQEYKQLQDKYNSDMKKLTTDIDRIRSTFQKSEAAKESEWRQRYEQMKNESHQRVISVLPEGDREAYEQQRLYDEYQELQQKYAALEQEVQDTRSIGDAVRAFAAMGIGLDKIDLSQGLRSVMESGWAAAGKELAESRAALAQASQAANQQSTAEQTTTQSSDQSEVSPPNVFTASGGAQVGKTWGDTIKAAENILGKTGMDEESVFRAVENGELDPKILPGME